MTHPKGAITFPQGGRYASPRSYIRYLHVFSNNDNTPFLSGSEITFHSLAFPSFREYVKLQDEWFNWSSNCYTLDFIPEWWYYQFNPTDPETPYGGVVKVEFYPPVNDVVLTIQIDSPNTHHIFDIPPAPPTYWLPMP